MFRFALETRNANEAVHSNLSMLDSAVAARRGSEGVSLLLQVNHNNADAVLADMRLLRVSYDEVYEVNLDAP